jgi:lycopene cyclase domain-containing protein
MSYLVFHLVLILPPIVLMASTLPASLDELGGWRARAALPLIAAIALTYTTAWDNYLVAREVWWYGPGRVVATIGFVPVEEYLFFILQPILTGLFLFQYLARRNGPLPPAGAGSAWGGFLMFSGITGGGILLLAGEPEGLYMGLVLTWACPLLAGMWLYDGETLWAHRRTLFYAVGVPTVYLWGADAIAITAGIWTISSTYTLGLAVGSLPVEEATFFLVTNLLVVKGILLLLYGSHEALDRSFR